LCKLPKGARVTPTGPRIGFWVPVRLDHPGCPAEGYVDAEFMETASAKAPERREEPVRRDPAPRAETAPPAVGTGALAARPGAALYSYDGTKLCEIPEGTRLSRGSKTIADWISVTLQVPGCPAE